MTIKAGGGALKTVQVAGVSARVIFIAWFDFAALTSNKGYTKYCVAPLGGHIMAM
eukprot:CAMPEP_0114442922 /NCGR_PEP_ID=MMETSP0103-20121206/17227_1 /TAXON_ID=37642 ORGANISM="Paraphysomonas imperforata, Strain PA2" /NCGR_SAMPLE_ID=MMETSP0103 /ASSEMBLY_ACC=CAM_ASM_000201 /LENGTH=54 /DNA_ID=CAMNT_0001614257 /DNA_START=532 /DNA_END=697 /DNA_ORIENTATION=+